MRETTAVAQTAGALGSTRFWVAEQFPEHLTTVMGLLGDEHVETSAPSATPAASRQETLTRVAEARGLARADAAA